MQLICPTLAALAIAAAFPAGAADSELNPVVVTATRQAQRANEALADVTVIERAQIEEAGASFSLPELLARQPGIQMATNGGPGKTASIFLRGGNGNHTLLLVDGMRVGSATTGTASWQDIPLSQIDHIEIVRGPASALYGADAMSGVIQIFTRKGEGAPRVEAFAGAGSYGARELSAGVSGGAERLSYALRGGYTTTDSFSAKSPRASFGYNPDRDPYRNTSLSGRLDYRIADGHELGATLLATEGRNHYDGDTGFDNYNNSAQRIFNLSSRNRITAGWTSTLRFGQAMDEYEGFTRAKPQGSTIRTTQNQFVWQNDVRLPLGSLLAAYENLHQKVLSEGAFDGGRTVNSALLGWTAGIGAHRVQLNARHDDNSDYGSKTTGYAGYGYQILPTLRVTGSVGSAFRAPTFNELYYPSYGNPNLKPENAYNKEVGLVWEQGLSSVSVVAFRNRVSDLIVNFKNAAGVSLPSNVREARIQGLSINGATRLAGFDLEAGVDFLDAKDVNSDANLPRRAKQSGHFRISRSAQRITGGVELVGVGGRYDAVSFSTSSLGTATERDRMGGYGLLNAFVKYAVSRDWSLEGRANNLLDKQYTTAYGYNTPGANVFFGVRYAPK